MIAVIRLRGSMKMRNDMKSTFRMLSMSGSNTLSVLEKTPSNIGMVKKIENFATWGEISQEMLQKLGGKKVIGLKPPKGGFKSIKKKYPAGDLGYRGDKINQLIERML